MGSSKYTFIGPYARFSIKEVEVTETKTYKSCSNPTCTEHKVKTSNAFCPKCGAKVVESEKSYSVMKKPRIWEILDDMNERGVRDNKNKLVTDDTFRYFEHDYGPQFLEKDEIILNDNDGVYLDNDEDVVDLIGLEPAKKLAEFKEKFKYVFAELEGRFPTVEYGYGSFTYWS